MSSFYQWHPKTEGNYRRQTGWESCAGVTQITRNCSCCKKPKRQLGGTTKGGKFTFADCKTAPLPNWFSAMVTGQIAIPAVPKRHVRPHRLAGEDRGAHGRDNRALVINALDAGYSHIDDITSASTVSVTYVREILKTMLAEGVVTRSFKGHAYRWKLV